MKRPSKLHRLAVAVSLFLLIAPDAAKATELAGAGANTCAVFENNYKHETMVEGVFFTWAQGFMSGLNLVMVAGRHEMTDLHHRGFDADKQKSHIRRYCDQHPLKDYSEAVYDLFNTMRGKQGLQRFPAQ